MNPYHVETISEGFLEPAWEEIGREEAVLIAQLKDEFRKAGATEAQLTWGMVDNVPLGYAARKRVNYLCRQLDELKEEGFPDHVPGCGLQRGKESNVKQNCRGNLPPRHIFLPIFALVR